MKAVILAAGEGARMGPFTASLPKVMIPVGNRPLLEYVVQALVENGVQDLLFVVGYRRERIQAYFQDGKAFVSDLLEVGKKPAVLMTESERPQSYGVVTIQGKNLLAITEKPTEIISNLINTGAYALDARIFDEIEALAKEGKHDLPRAVSALAKHTAVAALKTEGTWIDALYPWDLLRLNAVAL